MNLRDRIRRELTIAFEWGEAKATSGILTTKENVIESGVQHIETAIYGEVVAGATIQEMSQAMGQIRMKQAKPTAALMGEIIWQLRYDKATEEQKQYDTAAGIETEGEG